MFFLTVLCIFMCLKIPSCVTLEDQNSLRLPNNSKPLRYEIKLHSSIHTSELNFTGTALITFQVLNDTNEVVIHQQNLIVSRPVLYMLNENFTVSSSIPIQNVVYGTNNYTIITSLNFALVKDKAYLIQTEYTGVLNTQPFGFYAASYLNEHNESVYMAMTQFKPNFARQMFPCFDEPHLKAIFNLQITHGNNFTAISNMPGTTNVVPGGSMVTTTFQDTPPISTYSVSLILTNLTSFYSAEDSNKILYEAYSGSGKIDQLGMLPEVGRKVLPTFSNTLGVKYRLPQLVQVVFSDFNTSTTSSWGVITYRDSPIYFDPTDYDYQLEENIIKLITREIATQFIGHSVSPEWWNSDWLFEALCVITTNSVLNVDYPWYRAIDEILTNEKQRIMVLDRNGAIPIIEYDIETIVEGNDILTADANSKASLIIYMMMHAIQEEVFHEGLTQIMAQNENSTISAHNFFTSLDTIARSYGTLSVNTSLPNMINSWIKQKGVPVLTVTRDYSSGSVTITQTLLGLNGAIDESMAIPYNFLIKHEAKLNAWLTTPHGWFDLRTLIILLQPTTYRTWTATDWILFNKKSTGYYRVNYDRDNWYLLIMDLSNSETFSLVHYLNRAQLIDDSFAFAKENLLAYDVPLNVARFLQFETEYFVWQSFYTSYKFLEQILYETDAYDHLSTYIQHLGGKVFDNFESRNYHDVLTHKILINILCRAVYFNCGEKASGTVMEFLNNAVALPQYLEEEYLNNGIRFISVQSVIQLFKMGMASTDDATRLKIFNGLGFNSNSESMETLLKATITNNNENIDDIVINLTSNERKIILRSIINNNRVGFRLALNFLRTEQEAYRRIMYNEIPDILQSISYRIGTTDSFSRFQALVDLYKNLQTQSTLYMYLENAKQNIDWLSGRLDEIRKNLQAINNENSDARSLYISFILICLSQLILNFMK